MKRVYVRLLGLVIPLSLMLFPVVVLANDGGWDSTSQASNTDSIANTRHNLTVSYSTFQETMNIARNDYDRVCVYCHTPHGASTEATMKDAPLWNRTNGQNTYTVFTDPLVGRGMLSGQDATQPGVSSLTCLSCHDGTVAIDSIINMPGSGWTPNESYTGSTDNETGFGNDAFLDSWTNPTGGDTNIHGTLAECSDACHNAGNIFVKPDFGVFVIGTDLTNDHPIGIVMPDAVLYGFNEPTVIDGNKWFFDDDGDERADRNEIRLYNTGGGFEVECASCHDPHGVIVGGGDLGPIIPSFLRVANHASTVCLTCHIK